MIASLDDIRQALRSLARARGHTLVASLVLGIAIGISSAVFSVVEAVLLRPLPFPDADRLVFVSERHPTLSEMSVAYPDFLDWRAQSRSFESLALFRFDSFNMSGLERPERIEGRRFSAGMLHVLGITPALGRDFEMGEDRKGTPPVALVQYAFWKDRLGGSASALGRSLVLDGTPHTIVGVLPPGFRFLGPPFSVVVPAGQLDPGKLERSAHPGFYAVGRLQPGVTIRQARDEMNELGRALGERYIEDKSILPSLLPVRERVARDWRTTLLLLTAAAGCMLLVAVANVTTLAVARAFARRREMAIRVALGASRARIIRDVLVEHWLLGILAGALGLSIAYACVHVLSSLRPNGSMAAADIEVNASVLGFVIGVSVTTSLLAAVVPALTFSDPNVFELLRASDPALGGDRRLAPLRAVLVVGEIAAACVLLAVAGRSIYAFIRSQRVDPGFRPDHVLTMNLSAPAAGYPSAVDLRIFHRRLVDAVSSVPGVRSVAVSLGLPLAGVNETSFRVEGQPAVDPRETPFATYFPASPSFLKTVGVSLRDGRLFTESDRADSARVIIVDEALALRFFPGRSALGERLHVFVRGAREIVGVVRHVQAYPSGSPELAAYQIFLPLEQFPEAFVPVYARDVVLTVRTGGPPLSAVDAVRGAIATVDPALPPYAISTMERVARDSTMGRRLASLLLGASGGIAALLACVGIYGVIASMVMRREHEFGIRVALGAHPGDVQRLVVLRGLGLLCAGFCAGAVLSFVAWRCWEGRIAPGATGALAFCVAGLGMLVAGILAAWLPARRAARVDPAILLRQD